MESQYISELQSLLDEDQYLLEESSLRKQSKDFYWYSPILKEELQDKEADIILYPKNTKEIMAIFSIAVKHHIPVQFKGAATGNYGQIIPLEGGIIIDTKHLNEIIDIQPGQVRVQPGARMGKIEKILRSEGQELCIFPSTYLKATAGGFVSGGSGGIGSITWGNLWDGNVIELTIITLEENPQIRVIRGEELLQYIHSYGTTGFIAEIVFRTNKRIEWIQSIASFTSLENSLHFSKELAYAENIKKRSVSTCEWPIPSYFVPLKKVIREDEHVVFIEVNEEAAEDVITLAHKWHGEIIFDIPADKYHKGLTLSDYTWNHTTLWALKADDNMTYLQASFDLDQYMDQVEQIQAKYKDEFYQHFDWMRMDGKVVPQSIPLIRFKSKEQLNDIISFCESIGLKMFDPHTFLLEEGGWEAHVESLLNAKKRNDPKELLNPGKVRSKEIKATTL